jgi:hypothetical protein
MGPHDGAVEPTPPPSPDPNPVRTKGRRLRRLELASGWSVVVVLVVGLVAGGPWFLFVPALAFGALVAANTVAAVQRRGPEEQALTPGRLARAVVDHDPVVVPATWAPRRRARERERREGTLGYSEGRLRFTVAALPSGRSARSTAPDLAGVHLLDAEPWELCLGPAPTLWHPQLVVVQGSTTHVLDLSPGWDLAAVGVGVHVAGEWHRQLGEIGVRTSAGPGSPPPAPGRR